MDALDILRVPTGDLIHFLSQTLGLGSSGDAVKKDVPAKPLIMISSILILCMKQLSRNENVPKVDNGDVKK